MLYVFALTKREANEFAKRNKLQPKQFRYVVSDHYLDGVGSGNTWVALIGFWRRSDYTKLAERIHILKICHGFDNVDKEYKLL